MAYQIAQLAADQHQRAVDQHIADHEPLHVGQHQVEVAGDRRQGHIDSDIERRERRPETDDRETERRSNVHRGDDAFRRAQSCLPRKASVRSQACLAAVAS
jgi:hypothetical protein